VSNIADIYSANQVQISHSLNPLSTNTETTESSLRDRDWKWVIITWGDLDRENP